MYTKIDYENYLEKLNTINGYDWVKNHLKLKEKPNFWTILEYGEKNQYGERSAHETRTSRMLRWLMDANETHGLGNEFAVTLLKEIHVPYPFDAGKNKAIKAIAEYKDIDVLYRDDARKLFLSIELKQYDKERIYDDGKSQLDKYEDIINEKIEKEANDFTAHYIYLTPQEDEPSNKRWKKVGYVALIDIIDNILENRLTDTTLPHRDDTRKILQDFKDDLQRSYDYSSTENKNIHTMLSEEERQLTIELANEIERESNTDYLVELQNVNQNKLEQLEELIVITNEYIYTQNKTPNEAVRTFTRKVYNYLSADKQLDTVNVENGKNGPRTLTRMKQDFIDEFEFTIDRVQVTQRKGQGLYFFDKDDKFKIYLSGDADGYMPNHGVQLLDLAGEEIKARSQIIKTNNFILDGDLIQKDKLLNRAGEEISLEQFIYRYLLRALRELAKEAHQKMANNTW